MGFRTTTLLAGVLFLFLFAFATATPAAAGDLLLAQGPPMQGQGRPMGGGGGGGNNSCMQSYQRCVMICAGVANCINNCNVGYAACTQQGGGGRPGGQGGGPRPGK
ncbi:hypothetical protein DesfrDRAFT_1350 [Solidesulfovibrio fructosivorans JJ]]|uniref:Uncharacterized protein n=1 Tax=Solidesulfovibrio fructosivorans JJ] TaxID=596151 RepID=E1JUQ1_SOLFR|nr:hypothetical protein [Solidesulfovibrio fructosivorans]EFL51815.1 hypothetical protein DesfrDRAFT_1350 [Solidesulfovibrio fructosivorans JJ]]